MGGYSQALEEQMRLLRFMQNGGGTVIEARSSTPRTAEDRVRAPSAICESITTTLRTAEAFYWSPEMCDVLAPIAASMPTWTLKRSDLLVPSGYMHFSKPLPMPSSPGEDWVAPLSGIGWHIVTEAGPDLGTIVVAPFTVIPEHAALPWGVLPFDDGEDIRGFLDQLSGSAKTIGFQQRAVVDRALTYIGASIALVRQQIISIPQERAERGIRKRLPDDWGREPTIRVVKLRRVSGAPLHQTESEAVAWACRWVVSGHWRQQACGPAWSERRPVFVLPYVKGPESQPLRVDASRVFEVVR